MLYFCYIIECSDGTYYTGFTTNISKRVEKHNSATGAKYTRSRLPVKLAYYETFETKEEAMSREWEIKHKYTRKEKEKLIKNANTSIQRERYQAKYQDEENSN